MSALAFDTLMRWTGLNCTDPTTLTTVLRVGDASGMDQPRPPPTPPVSTDSHHHHQRSQTSPHMRFSRPPDPIPGVPGAPGMVAGLPAPETPKPDLGPTKIPSPKKIKKESPPLQNGNQPKSPGPQVPSGDMSVLINPDRRYLCPHCYKGFKSRQQLTQHNLVHSNLRKYHCKFCERSFKQLSHLHQHHRIHTGEKPYRCPLEGCDRAFPQLSNLQHHIRNHDKLVDSQYQCHLCDRAYPNEATLKAHNTRTHLHAKPLDLTQQQQQQQQQQQHPALAIPMSPNSHHPPGSLITNGNSLKQRKRKASRPQHLYMPPTMVPMTAPLTPEEDGVNSVEQKSMDSSKLTDKLLGKSQKVSSSDALREYLFRSDSPNGLSLNKNIPMSRSPSSSQALKSFDRIQAESPVRHDLKINQSNRGMDMNLLAMSKSFSPGSQVFRGGPLNIDAMLRSPHMFDLPSPKNNYGFPSFPRQQFKPDHIDKDGCYNMVSNMHGSDPTLKQPLNNAWSVMAPKSNIVTMDAADGNCSDSSSGHSENFPTPNFSLENFDEPMN